MMKTRLFMTIALSAALLDADAQKVDTARLLIHYQFTWVRDTADRAHPYTENMALYVGKNASAYRSYDRVVANARFKKAYAEAVAASPDGNARINRSGGGTPVEYYQYPGTRRMLTRDNLLVNDYLVESPLPAISWRIETDTASFAGLHCQKATGRFKGRDYTAWFCPDLPVHSGPWKLNGLPGVIVDAHDAKNEIVFKFGGVEKAIVWETQARQTPEQDLPPILRGLNDDPSLVLPPATAIKTTQKEFDKLKETLQKDPNAFAQAVMANNRGGGAKMDQVVVPKGPAPRGPVYNNPMELPENQ